VGVVGVGVIKWQHHFAMGLQDFDAFLSAPLSHCWYYCLQYIVVVVVVLLAVETAVIRPHRPKGR